MKSTLDLNRIISILDSPETEIYYVDCQSGQIFIKEIETKVDAVLLPSCEKIDIFRIIRDFCRSLKDVQIQEALLFTIQGKGAFGRFKKGVHFHHLTGQWNRFRHQRIKQFAIQWCKENDFLYHYERPSDLDS